MQSTCTYHSILSKAQELKNHIDNENSQDKVKGMVKLMKKQSQLFSLSEVFTNLKDINPFIDSILDPATTGYTSDAYEDDEESNARVTSLSLSEVKNLLIDERVVNMLPTGAYTPDDAVLIINNVSRSVNYFTFKVFYGKLQFKPTLVKVKFLFLKGTYC
jgi:hypothetical protein